MTHETTFQTGGSRWQIIDLPAAAGDRLARMPHIHRILLENVLRTAGPDAEAAAGAILAATDGPVDAEIPFLPCRVLMHDTTCGPALVDVAGMRSTLAEAGFDPALLNPVLPVDVSTDHSLAVDAFGGSNAMARNLANEYRRNGERYRFMKWAASALDRFTVHPPGTGIMHTLNLERLSRVVQAEGGWLFPDAMIGTDSHTPMVNGIGVLAWGVGGIEAESVFFGMPVTLRVPDVVGVRMTGQLPEGVTATDLALTVTERLRRIDLADRFVEFFGPGVSTLSAGERSVIANMTPEFGANTGFFPVDQAVLDYLTATGREPGHVALVGPFVAVKASG
jgi:aconitate hydratase